ncbi:MAG: hypothetical protein RJB39_143 [Candidatus Parcubacteria bacterium]|jgi:hypothetical protein
MSAPSEPAPTLLEICLRHKELPRQPSLLLAARQRLGINAELIEKEALRTKNGQAILTSPELLRQFKLNLTTQMLRHRVNELAEQAGVLPIFGTTLNPSLFNGVCDVAFLGLNPTGTYQMEKAVHAKGYGTVEPLNHPNYLRTVFAE